MTFLENPFALTPAAPMEFTGRRDILERWRERLTEGSGAWIGVLCFLFAAGAERAVG